MSHLSVTPEVAHAPGQFVELDDGRVWVEIEGPAAGEPLVLLSGGPANSHLTFHPAFSALADRYRVIYVDYRGRGRSGKPASYHDITFAGDVADIEALRKTLGIDAWHVYGFSYGGMVAQGYALAYPHAVRRLILANTLHSPEMWQRNH
ncbi:MAG: alpha/beta fold hydrolase, partial [Ktedonobacterales bacterium]